MEKFSCRAVTINNCMGTIMPLAETSACLTLSLLNDAGYLAYCESDFIVVLLVYCLPIFQASLHF